jgi:hypothetical protein
MFDRETLNGLANTLLSSRFMHLASCRGFSIALPKQLLQP